MPNDNNNILKYNHGEKSMRAPFVIYAGFGCLLEKMHSCQNNPENIFTQRQKFSIHLLVTHCLQIVHLMKQKTNLIVTKVKTVWKSFVKTEESIE